MTKIMPDFRAYRKQDNMPSYNDLGQDYPIKLPTQTRDEPAKLARLDTGGQYDNRPMSSLRSILLPWLPQTTASLNGRLVALDLIRQRERDVAWTLMRGLLPEHGGI
ncbi:MAG: hypothetical protein Q8N51_17920, partial [Gammaproteobacteria bacterium]|nr:hypothetical protein [Gammaproteobacteria bacterium]